MPRSDDRFARQNRGGLPPEFPLASPCPGIDHHLSGPNVYAPTPCRRRGGAHGSALRAGWEKKFLPRSRPLRGGRHPSRFHCAVAWLGDQAPRLAYRLDSLVRVSRRVGKEAVLLRRRHVADRIKDGRLAERPPFCRPPRAVVPSSEAPERGGLGETRRTRRATRARRNARCAFDTRFSNNSKRGRIGSRAPRETRKLRARVGKDAAGPPLNGCRARRETRRGGRSAAAPHTQTLPSVRSRRTDGGRGGSAPGRDG